MALALLTMQSQLINAKPRKGAAGYGKKVGGRKENYSLWLLHSFEYGRTRGQIKILTKSDGMHSSEVGRVHFEGEGPH